MRARREVTLSALCVLLVACSAAASSPDESHDATIEGVGILPGSNPDTEVVASAPSSTVAATELATTTTVPLPPIGSLITGNRLLMIGDSITASAAKRYGDELCDALVPLGWQVEVDAEPSRFVDFGNEVLDARLAAKWDAAYVFLGTNYLGDQLAYRRQLEKIVERLSPSPVVLLTVTLFDTTRQEVNDAITLVSAEFSNVRVVDWGSIAAANAATILRGDGHHLTNEGRLALASTVAGVLGKAPKDPGKCLGTSFSDDSGASVNGSDEPPPNPIGTPTTVKSPTTTTIAGGGGTPTTTKPPASGTTAPLTTLTTPPTTPAPPTTPPTSPDPGSGATDPTHPRR